MLTFPFYSAFRDSTTWRIDWTEFPGVEISDVATASVTVDTLDADASPTTTGSADGDIFISTHEYPPDPNTPVATNIPGEDQVEPFNFDHRMWRWDGTNSEWVFQQWLFGFPQTYDAYIGAINEAARGRCNRYMVRILSDLRIHIFLSYVMP